MDRFNAFITKAQNWIAANKRKAELIGAVLVGVLIGAVVF